MGTEWLEEVEALNGTMGSKAGRKVLRLGSGGSRRQSSFSEFLGEEESNSSQSPPVASTLLLSQELGHRKSELLLL